MTLEFSTLLNVTVSSCMVCSHVIQPRIGINNYSREGSNGILTHPSILNNPKEGKVRNEMSIQSAMKSKSISYDYPSHIMRHIT